MSPATHAVLGAAIAGAAPRLWIALPLAFLSHFVCDAIYHFEAFYPLSRKLGVSHDQAFGVTVVALGIALLPGFFLLARRDRNLLPFYTYAGGVSALLVLEPWPHRLAAATLIAGVLLLFSGSARVCRWVLGAFAATLPDLARWGFKPLNRLHVAMHYEGIRDLGDVLYRLFRQEPSLFVGDRFNDVYYVIGYVIEVVIEVTLLLGGLYVMTRRPPPREGGESSGTLPL